MKGVAIPCRDHGGLASLTANVLNSIRDSMRVRHRDSTRIGSNGSLCRHRTRHAWWRDIGLNQTTTRSWMRLRLTHTHTHTQLCCHPASPKYNIAPKDSPALLQLCGLLEQSRRNTRDVSPSWHKSASTTEWWGAIAPVWVPLLLIFPLLLTAECIRYRYDAVSISISVTSTIMLMYFCYRFR